MPDYKEMYLELFRASEKAIRQLIEAQRKCEEIYLQDDTPPVILFPVEDPKDDC